MTPHSNADQAKYQRPTLNGAELKNSRNPTPRIVVLTGAGISAESGISTFRDANGLWENHRIEEVASPRAFAANPDLVHRFYDARRAQLHEVSPNAAHWALSRLEAVFPGEVLIITQNVDDLHEQARSENVLHMHGRLRSALCTSCGAREDHHEDLGDRPACRSCGERALRPDIVWFGERIHEEEAIRHAVENCEIFAAIGTSGIVHPAAGFVKIAAEHGARTVLLDLNPDAQEGIFDVRYAGLASKTVPHWVREVMLRQGDFAAIKGDGYDLAAELEEDIQEFVGNESFQAASDFDYYTENVTQALLDRLSIKAPKHHPALWELPDVLGELSSSDSLLEAGSMTLVKFIMAHSEATNAIRAELRREQISFAADLIAWIVADSAAEFTDPAEDDINFRVTKWFGFLGDELRRAGREDLASLLSLDSDLERACRRGNLPTELAKVLGVAMDMGIALAFGAERDRLVVEYLRANASSEDCDDVASKVEHLIHIQERFLGAKRRGDVSAMRSTQAEFSKAMNVLTPKVNWMSLMELLVSVGSLNTKEAGFFPEK